MTPEELAQIQEDVARRDRMSMRGQGPNLSARAPLSETLNPEFVEALSTRGYLIPDNAARIVQTDTGPQALDVFGKEIPFIKRPAVLPLVRNDGEVKMTMPQALDVFGNVVGGVAMRGAHGFDPSVLSSGGAGPTKSGWLSRLFESSEVPFDETRRNVLKGGAALAASSVLPKAAPLETLAQAPAKTLESIIATKYDNLGFLSSDRPVHVTDGYYQYIDRSAKLKNFEPESVIEPQKIRNSIKGDIEKELGRSISDEELKEAFRKPINQINAEDKIKYHAGEFGDNRDKMVPLFGDVIGEYFSDFKKVPKDARLQLENAISPEYLLEKVYDVDKKDVPKMYNKYKKELEKISSYLKDELLPSLSDEELKKHIKLRDIVPKDVVHYDINAMDRDMYPSFFGNASSLNINKSHVIDQSKYEQLQKEYDEHFKKWGRYETNVNKLEQSNKTNEISKPHESETTKVSPLNRVPSVSSLNRLPTVISNVVEDLKKIPSRAKNEEPVKETLQIENKSNQ